MFLKFTTGLKKEDETWRWGGDKNWGKLRSDSEENLKLISSLGYQGRVVVELGWPDVDQNLTNWQGDLSYFLKTHQEIVKFLKSL